MHVFCLVIRKTDDAPRRGEVDAILQQAAARLLPFPIAPEHAEGHRWAATDGSVLFYGWSRFGPDDVFHVDPDGGFAAIEGWIGPRPSTAAEVYPCFGGGVPRLGGAAGEYLALAADSTGTGMCVRNTAGGMPLYLAENGDIAVLSNRAGIAAFLTGGPSIDHDPVFHAINIATGWQLADHTMYAGVRSVAPGSCVRFSRTTCEVVAPVADPWYAPALLETYRTNPTSYWDTLFNILTETVRDVVVRAAGRGGVTVRLSGGKDSRLLLALLVRSGACDRIDLFSSSGDPGNADADIAAQMATHFNLPFERQSHAASATGINAKFGDHVFLTEAAISPYDLCRHPEFSDQGTVLTGHEAGLRNGATNNVTTPEAFEVWLRSHHHGFDALGILTPEAAAQVEHVARDIVLNPGWADTIPENLPTWHRLTSRMARCSAVMQSVESARGFSPHLLAIDLPIISQYTLGEDIRRAELFHYEMMMRADPWLVRECPFVGEQWAPQLFHYVDSFDQPAVVNHPTVEATNIPFNRDALLEWLLKPTSHPLFDIVDAAKLRRLAAIDFNDGHLQRCLWNIIQSRTVLGLDNLTDLTPWADDRTPIDLPFMAEAPLLSVNVA